MSIDNRKDFKEQGEKAKVCQMTQEVDWKSVATGLMLAQSPDLNITEAVWDHLDRERNKRQPTSKELWNVLQEAWRTIPGDYLKKLNLLVQEGSGCVE